MQDGEHLSVFCPQGQAEEERMPTLKSTHFRAATTLLLISSLVLSLPSAASATSVATAFATLDWSGLTVEYSPGLSLTVVPQYGSADSFANTDVFGAPRTLSSSSESKIKGFVTGIGPDDWSYTSAFLPSSGLGGTAYAQASTANGLLATGAETSFVDLLNMVLGAPSSTNSNHADSLARTETFAFSIAGTGSGTVSVSIPYTLSLFCNAGADGTATAAAEVGVTVFSISSPSKFIVPQPCNGVGSSFESGTISLSWNYTFPGSSFPYVPGVIQLVALASATSGTTRVPEASPALLILISGLMGLAVCRRRQQHWRCDRQSDGDQTRPR
jgi:hypothetical protein